MRGVRITYGGAYTTLTTEAVGAYLDALRDNHGLRQVGAAVVRADGDNLLAAIFFATGFAVLRVRGDKLLITLEADGDQDGLALERLTAQTFGVENITIISDITSL